MDIISTTAVLISGELESETRTDRHGCHYLDDHPLYRNKLLHIPLVNQYAKILRDLFPDHAPISVWPEGKRFAMAFTHDVDYPEIIRSIEFVRYVAQNGMNSSFQAMVDIIRGSSNFWQFKNWMTIEREHEIRSAYFFCARKGSLSKYLLSEPDPFYDINDEHFRALFAELTRNGHEIGIHYSYNTIDEVSRFTSEKRRLEAVLDEEICGSRHHYWRVNHNKPYDTAKLQGEAGLLYDMSGCFERRCGFRYGTGTPFYYYDDSSPSFTPSLQLTTTIMDDHLFGYKDLSYFDHINAEVDALIDAAEQYQCFIGIDFHARVLNNDLFPGWGAAYQRLMGKSSSGHCYCDTPQNIAQYWVSRSNRIQSNSLDEDCSPDE